MEVTSITKGVVLKVTYFLTLGKFRRVFFFVGLCCFFRKRSKTITLRNYHHSSKENLEFNFIFNSPYVFNVLHLVNYNFTKNLKKIRSLKVNSYSYTLYYNKPLKKYDPYDYLYGANTNFHERHRLKRRFRI